MDSASTRLQEARERAGFANATEAARAFGWNENTYRSHENGERGIRAKIAQKYAQAFSVSLSWLVTGEGVPDESNIVSVTGFIEEGGHVLFYNPDIANIAAYVAMEVPELAVACMVLGNSLYPRYSDHDLLLCWKSELTDKSLEPLEGVAELDGGECRFGTLVLNDPPTGTLEIFGSKPIRNVAVRQFQPVQVVIRAAACDYVTPTGSSKQVVRRTPT